MQKVFGEIWWDYNEKPLNYRGIICLESSIAWGVYTVGLFLFLHNFVVGIVDRVPPFLGKLGGSLILVAYVTDFMLVLYREKKDDIPEYVYDKVYGMKESLLSWFDGE